MDQLVIAVTLYSRAGCHLCDEMKALVTRVTREAGDSVALEEVDISSDAELEARYGIEIPVLIVNGRKVAKYRVTEPDLRRMLTTRAG